MLHMVTNTFGLSLDTQSSGVISSNFIKTIKKAQSNAGGDEVFALAAQYYYSSATKKTRVDAAIKGGFVCTFSFYAMVSSLLVHFAILPYCYYYLPV